MLGGSPEWLADMALRTGKRLAPGRPGRPRRDGAPGRV